MAAPSRMLPHDPPMPSHAGAVPRDAQAVTATVPPPLAPAAGSAAAGAAGRTWGVVSALVLAGAACWLAWSLWHSRHYVPIWDARVYADCAVRAASQPFAPSALRCAQHPTHAYFAVVSTIQRLAPGSPSLLVAANALLLALGAAAFAHLLRLTFPDAALRPERALLAAAFLVDPVIVAGAVQLNPDFGTFVFLLVATAAAAAGRFRLAALLGLLAAFSKETGSVLYAAMVAAFGIALVLPGRLARPTRNALLAAPLAFLTVMALLPWAPWSLPLGAVAAVAAPWLMLGEAWAPRATLARLARAVPLAVVAAPLLAFVAYTVWRATLPNTAMVWRAMEPWFVLRLLATPHFLPESVTYLGQIFVLNFHWIAGAVIAADLLVGARRFVADRPARVVPGAQPQVLLAMTLFGVAGIFLVTRIPTAPIARYLLPVFPALLVLFLAALLRLGTPPHARRAILAAYTLLLGLSVHRSLDPIPKLVWGTYPVGTHSMVSTSAFLARPNFGLDESLYNLEFLRVAQLSQLALDRLHPLDGRVLVIGYHADWNIVGPLDARSQRRLGRRPLTAPTLAHAEDLIAGRVRPDSAWYLAVPYLRNEPLLRRLATRYEVGPPESLTTDGYAMSIRRLTARRAAANTTAPTPAIPAPDAP